MSKLNTLTFFSNSTCYLSHIVSGISFKTPRLTAPQPESAALGSQHKGLCIDSQSNARRLT
ncbi:hypothetical protein [Pseudomonas sp. PI1]|uniref:hypothetical protein n=1 Tax=Pseudomonas sp. PI1 TaxID=1582493 RepID=UPI000A54535C|nr:hypothetical protein [Pseudomonas sp. PI1]